MGENEVARSSGARKRNDRDADSRSFQHNIRKWILPRRERIDRRGRVIRHRIAVEADEQDA